MGDIADQIENEFWANYGLEEDFNDYGYRSRGNKKKHDFQAEAFLWRDKNGNVLRMRDMTTAHLMNCLAYADNYKTREIEQILEERAREENNRIPVPEQYGKAPDNPRRKRLFGDN